MSFCFTNIDLVLTTRTFGSYHKNLQKDKKHLLVGPVEFHLSDIVTKLNDNRYNNTCNKIAIMLTILHCSTLYYLITTLTQTLNLREFAKPKR